MYQLVLVRLCVCAGVGMFIDMNSADECAYTDTDIR